MAELDTITVRGFKSIAALDQVQLRPINILIGPNGSGKSNFIGIFAFLNAIRQGHLEEYVIRAGGAEKILHFGSKRTESLRIHISFEDGRNQYQIDLHPTENDGLLPFKETVYFWDRERFPEGVSSLNMKSHCLERLLPLKTASSKRVRAIIPEYEKPLFGTLAALEIGLDVIRAECPHFRQWLEKLESLASLL